MLLKDKIAIVTGGTRGIGFSIVREMLKEGAKVVLCGSRKETVDNALEALNKENSDWEVRGIYPNLSDYDAVKSAFDKVVEEFGRVDILVNNAGVSENTPFVNYELELFQRVMDLNVNAVFNCTRAIVDHMIENESGVIINTSSMVSKYGQPAGVAYPTSKFAVNGMTLSLARELGPKGIRVNAVAPGVTATDMVSALPEEVINPLIATIPLRRVGEPEDIANAVVFLASDKASYISGAILSVDGLARS